MSDIVKRTVMIFPEFENMKVIDKIREKYDPLYDKVKPHITLIFPFESELTTEEIKIYLKETLKDIRQFELKLQKITYLGQWLFLNINKGRDVLIELHTSLYNIFPVNKPSWLNEYSPHMTIGKFDTEQESRQAYESVKGISAIFHTTVTKVSVEVIGENEESIIEYEYSLKQEW